MPPISSTTNNVSQSHVVTADDRTLKGRQAVCCWWQRFHKKFKGTPKTCSKTEMGRDKNEKPDTITSQISTGKVVLLQATKANVELELYLRVFLTSWAG